MSLTLQRVSFKLEKQRERKTYQTWRPGCNFLRRVQRRLKKSKSSNHRYLRIIYLFPVNRLREVDVKAEQFERQVKHAEQERDEWQQKTRFAPLLLLITLC